MSGPSHTPTTEENRSETTNTNDNKSNSNLPESSPTKRFFGGVFNKNLFGSSQDMMNHSLLLRNQNLTVQLVQAKKDWEALQKSFRANTHGRFVYQTTLARIVAHVQDFCDPTDPKMVQLVHDLVQWTHDCEHIPTDCRYQIIESKESGESNQSKISTTSNDSSAGGNESSSTGSVSRKVTNRGPIIDYADVQPFVDTSTVPLTKFLNHHETIQDQNDSLQKEIAKWQQSMARIRMCNQREAVELLCHQKTLRKVVERIQASTFPHIEDVQLWYKQCQQEAERCGSFSEPEAREFCRRCHSKLSNDEADSDQECIEDEEHLHHHDDGDTHPATSAFVATEKKSIAPECPTTPSTVATATMEEPSPAMDTLPQAPHMPAAAAEDGSNTITLLPSAKAIAAANVEDPPEIIKPTATNIQESSRMQVQPTAHRHSGCGDSICSVM